ncbi:MAG: helix-turn-helix domain-containing protein [Planctomycetota bacterium]
MPLGHAGCAALAAAGVRSVGIDDRVPHSAWGEGCSPTRLLFFVRRGVVVHADGAPSADAGSVFLIPAPVPKEFRTQDEGCRAIYVHLSADNAFRVDAEQPSVQAATAPERIEAIVEGLLAETLGEAADATRLVSRWTDLLVAYLHRQFPAAPTPAEAELRRRIDRVWEEFSARLAEDWTVGRLANLAHLSEGHFHRVTKRLYGRSPQAMVRRLRMERAADLLRTTNLTTGRIAAEVGYATGFALSNALQKELGLRPRSIRRPPAANPTIRERHD